MKIALCQYHIEWEDKERNQKKAAEFIKNAATKHCSLILFPEMSFTGFTMNLEMAEMSDGPTVSFLQEQAQRHCIGIGAGYGMSAGAKGENHYLIVDKTGEIILDYGKIHPFSFSGEDKYYQGGESLSVAEIEEVPVGAMICYDLRFPEPFLKLSEKAHLIVVPANWPESRSDQWLALLKARAIENQAYIAGINCVGHVGSLYYSGNSCFIDPKGKVTEAALGEEDLLICEFEDNVEKIRERFPVRQDRRPELYQRLEV